MSEISSNEAAVYRQNIVCSKVLLVKIFCGVIFSLFFIGLVIALVKDEEVQEKENILLTESNNRFLTVEREVEILENFLPKLVLKSAKIE